MIQEDKQYCNECQGWRDHKILSEVLHPVEYEAARDDIEPLGPVWFRQRCTISCCAGCGAVCFTIEEEDGFYAIGEAPAATFRSAGIDVYPPRNWPPVGRSLPSWSNRIADETVRELLRQVYAAHCAGAHSLAAMGARAVVEQIMIRRCGDHRSFEENLKAYRDAVGLGVATHDGFTVIIEAGNAAIHRGHNPDREQIESVLDELERVVKEVYFIEGVQAKILERIPPRQPRKRKSPPA